MSLLKPSKKRFAAKLIADKRLEQTVFYLDESIYSKKLLTRLRQTGAQIEHAGGAVNFGTSDDEWLKVCGDRGWVVLTRDNRIRYRRREKEALRTHKVAAFVMVAKGVTSEETADITEQLLPEFVRRSASETKPFVYTFGRAKKLNRINLD